METEQMTEAAKRIYIAYVQLNDLLRELGRRLEYGVNQRSGMYWHGAASYARSFNAILKSARDGFGIDEGFLESI